MGLDISGQNESLKRVIHKWKCFVKILALVILICVSAIDRAAADYSLPVVKERLVLLVDLRDVNLDKRVLVFSVDKVQYKFEVNSFWMQHHIWSDGLCVLIQDSDSKSSATRIREVQLAIAKQKESLLLVELVCVTGTRDFTVTYLKLFDPKTEYERYFPKKLYYDTITLPFDSKPKDKDDFVAELRKATAVSQQRIKEHKATTTSTNATLEAAPVAASEASRD